MREIRLELEGAKQRVKILQNHELRIKINKGRNKFITLKGRITDIYPSIFVIHDDDDNKEYTYSYNDILIKTIQFFPPIAIEIK